MLDGVTLCHENGLTLPMLTLIYANIDALGWLASESETATAETFTAWVDRFLDPQDTLGCTALDLYAARCGVLHTGTPESRLYRTGRARQIVYAAEGNAADLQAFVKMLNDTSAFCGTVSTARDTIAVDTGALYHAYVKAVHAFDTDRHDNPDAYPQYVPKMLKTFMARRKTPASE